MSKKTNEKYNPEKPERIIVEAEVLAEHGNGFYRVLLSNGAEALAHVSGRLRKNRIRIIPEDSVTVELSPADLSRGRIIWRSR